MQDPLKHMFACFQGIWFMTIPLQVYMEGSLQKRLEDNQSTVTSQLVSLGIQQGQSEDTQVHLRGCIALNTYQSTLSKAFGRPCIPALKFGGLL